MAQKENTSIKYLKLVAKVVFSSLAIYFVISKINIQEIGTTIRSANIWLLIIATTIYSISQLFAARRLNSLFKVIPFAISHIQNTKLYWLGLFYNLFLPGGIGGDGYKIFLINKYHKIPVKKLIGTILSDRLSGLSIILINLLALVYYIEYDLPLQGWYFLLIPFVAIGYYLFLYIFNRSLTRAFWPVIGWSVVNQGLQMIVAIIILWALGASVVGQRDDYLFLFFLSAITASIPITLGGIGAREVTFLYGAQYLGLNQQHAVALSVIFYIISVIAAFPGVIYTIKPDKLMHE